MKKQYPITDGENRKFYATTPVLVTEEVKNKFPPDAIVELGKWVCFKIARPENIPPLSPVHFSTQELCQQACDKHNSHHGWTEEEVKELMEWSIG